MREGSEYYYWGATLGFGLDCVRVAKVLCLVSHLWVRIFVTVPRDVFSVVTAEASPFFGQLDMFFECEVG